MAVGAGRPPLERDTVAADNKSTRRGDPRIGEWRGKPGKPARFGHGIVVDECDDFPRRRGQPQVAGDRDVGNVDGDDLGALRADRGRGRIGHHDQFEVRVVELANRGQTKGKLLRAVARNDYEADGQRARHAIPISAIIASSRGTSSGLLSSQN